MKLTIILCLLSVVSVLANKTYSQTKTLKLSMQDATVKEVLSSIEEQSEFYFMYSEKVIDVNRKVDVNIENLKVDATLNLLFEGTDVNYTINDRIIVLTTPEVFNVNSEIVIQQKSINGKVTDEADEPLPGVTVLIKGTTNGTVTNMDGNYSISNVPENATLQFSFVGMLTQEIVVGNQNTINVTMIVDAIGIEEVVAIGYGTQKKLELTNAVSRVKSDDFVKGAKTDAAQLIKGQIAGVRIINSEDNPTGTSQIVLRGITTLASGTQPLIVINGVPGSLDDIAPEDIETIDVLKDGSASAIYGTRGTNGVVLITTKSVNGETPATIEWTSYLTTQSIVKTLDYMNAEEYRELVKQGKPGAIDYGSNTNWTDEIFRTPISHTHNVSMKGGNSNTNYIMNVNYKSLEGLMLRSDNNVLNARIEANHTMFNGKLRINGSIMGYDQKYFAGGDGFSWRGDVYRNALSYNPTDPLKDENGNWTEHPDMNNYANPKALINEVEGTNHVTNLKPFGTIALYPIDGLTLKAIGSVNILNQTSGYSESFNHINSIKNSRAGYASRRTMRNANNLLELTANYKRTFEKHNFELLGGYSFQENQYEYYWMNNYDFPSDKYTYNNIGVGGALTEGRAGMDSNKTSDKLVSYFARANYNFDNRYLFMASLRYEGSSKFGTDNKWGAFPAVSAGWNLINESFMKELNYISSLKIRGGFGITGTIPGASYQSLSRLSYGQKYLFNGQWIPVIYPSSNANPDLKWETKNEINIGLEFGFFNNKISGEIDLYKRTTNDLIWNYSVATPPYLYNNVLANAGEIENQGIEIALSGTPVKSLNFEWNASVNFSTNKNTLISLSNDYFKLTSNYFYAGDTGEPIKENTHIVKEGESIGDFYGFKTIDIDNDGFWIIEDENGNPKPIADQKPEDKKVIGNGLPKHSINFNNSIRYKQFDLEVIMSGAFGFQILNMAKMFSAVPVNLSRGNIMKSSYDNIYGKRPLNDMQSLQYVSYFVEDGDYWKIDNITLGYNIPLKRKIIKSLRLYASGSNLFTFTGYSGIDPEVNSLGLNPGVDDRDRYPTTRTYTLGINLKF